MGSKLLDIHPVIIKENKEIIADHSDQLYNLSLVEIMFPNALKIARVIPAHKSGNFIFLTNRCREIVGAIGKWQEV